MKLFVVVRSTLSAGLKMAQAIHAFRGFAADHPILESYWHAEHNNIVVLQHEDPEGLAEDLESQGIRLTRFHEPDLGGQLTAICAEPAAERVLSNLPLARSSAA